MKDSKYIKINGINPSYLISIIVNGYFEEIDKCKYLTLVPTNESKENILKYEQLWSKIREFTITFVRAVFHENNKYYQQVFLDKCLYKS